MTQPAPPISGITLDKLLEAAQQLTAPAVVEEPEPAFRWGYCQYCKRSYQETEGTSDCPGCGRELAVRDETESELGRAYAKALILVQPLVAHEVAGPELSERIDRSFNLSSPVNPAFFRNATNPQVRKAINLMRGIAARYGLETGEIDPSIGQEIEIELRGERWIAFEDANGVLRPVRRVPIVADDNAALPAEWAEEATRGVPCPECGERVTSNFALAGHRRKHGVTFPAAATVGPGGRRLRP